jgi:hypothetical protein
MKCKVVRGAESADRHLAFQDLVHRLQLDKAKSRFYLMRKLGHSKILITTMNMTPVRAVRGSFRSGRRLKNAGCRSSVP